MIELSKTKKAKNKAATLINEVHQYIVDHYHVESIAPLATGNRAHHRVGYIVSIRPSPIAMAPRDEATTHPDPLE